MPNIARREKIRLSCRPVLAGSAFLWLLSVGSAAMAATQAGKATSTAATAHRLHRPAAGGQAAHARSARSQSTATPHSAPETLKVSVSRIRSHGAVQAVTRQQMDHFVEGTSPNQVLAMTTPGVSFASDDAFGLDTVANTLYIRGFSRNQVGASLDGIPMGEQGFGNINGLTVDEAVIQENLSGMTVSQGAGAVDTPSAQNLGGALTYTTSDPLSKAGGRVGQTFGSYNAFRTFGRVDSGVLNSTGTKFYASYARTDQDLWKGFGYQLEQQANFKLVQPVGDRGKITAIFDYSNFEQYNYMGLTKGLWETQGRNTTFLKPNYALAKEYAYYAQNGGVPANLQGILTNDEIGDYAYDGTQTQRNYLSAVTADFQLFPNVTSKTVAYAHVSSGDYSGTNPYLVSPTSGVDMAMETGHMSTQRIGFTQSFDIKVHDNDIQTGIWYENVDYSYPMRLYEDGVDQAHNSVGDFRASQASTWYSDAFNTNTFQFYLQDTYHIIPGMTINAGFRSLLQTTHGGTKMDDTAGLADWNTYYSHPANGSMTAANAFLPHFNWDYHFKQNHEVYFDIAENMRAYDYSTQQSSGTVWGGLGSASNPAQTVFNENKKTLRPERTWNYVVGYRYNSKMLTASVDFYHTDYYNRLATVTSGPTTNQYSEVANVGRESMNGADVLAAVRPVKGLEITNSFSWNDATYEGSINGTSLKGRHQVFYPKFMYKANLSYTWRRAMFNFNATYTGGRPLTYLNDQYIPAYWTSNLNGSYNFGKVGFARNIKATFGITNLFNKNYIGGVYGAASLKGDDNPILYVAAPREFFGSVSAQF
ncbi:TonB-dependent receptor domain-containing protein [Novacetimonas pomaceti]|uniref:TonB-dependent receptor domain-containing protein n=1 Tax=Novacetimonas pomaceti TaxID=2021998 RepID=UPI001C2D8780|nr:TonB-dependent receptor [Novacetimonas pomaceti]MBV1832526.1 TonB-dependent receptor [Novacetimonas pomaceti]